MSRATGADLRRALAAEVRRLREDEGMTFDAIGDALGIVKSTARSYYLWPDGRPMGRPPVRGHAPPCAVCGAPVAAHRLGGRDLCDACLVPPLPPARLEDHVRMGCALGEAGEQADPERVGAKSAIARALDRAIARHSIPPLPGLG